MTQHIAAPDRSLDGTSCSGSTRAPGRRKAGYIAVALLLPLAYGVAVIYGRAGSRARDGSRDLLWQPAVDRLTTELRQVPAIASQAVRLAHLHFIRVNLLATAAYERQYRGTSYWQLDQGQYAAWRRHYLQTDPEHAVSGALSAARLALQQDPPARERLDLLLMMATTLCSLGRHREEVAVLRQAARVARDPADVAGRLAQAYAESGQFRKAQAILGDADRHARRHLGVPSVPPGCICDSGEGPPGSRREGRTRVGAAGAVALDGVFPQLPSAGRHSRCN
jgi:hypothetical protein